MDKIPFEDGTKTQEAYVTIDSQNYQVTPAIWSGDTPLSAFNLNKMQDNIDNAKADKADLDTLSTKVDSKADKNDLDDLSSTVNDLTSKITELQKPKRIELFNNSSNQSKTINLADSVYNYSYIYLQNAANYNVIIPIYSDNQTNLRGIGGWTGAENAGTNHFYGTLSNEGKTVNVTYFRAMVHNANGDHNEGADYDVTMVVGVR